MKVAISADVHLTKYTKNPERYHALENLLDQMISQEIETLIIAGDLFDASCIDPGEFEKFYNQKKYSKITLYLIPGNHDPVLAGGLFTLPNLKYKIKPELVQVSKEIPFLFLPYKENSSIGEALASISFPIPSDNWIIVAHGDWLANTALRNNYESGFYMPLTSRDIQLYKPQKVFLGHIHAGKDTAVVHYPGSPCGLDISENGIKSFLVFDTGSGKVERIPLDTDVIYFQELLTFIPLDDEVEYIKRMLNLKMTLWSLNEKQKKKAVIRIAVQGYSSDRNKISKAIIDEIRVQGYKMYEPPDLSRVKISNDVMRADIAEAVQEKILELNLPQELDEPTNDEYILSALSQVYGG